MKIVIETIPHDQQRYDSPGDWFYDHDGTLQIRVSQLGVRHREALMAVHELVEALSCEIDNISQALVDSFDLAHQSEGAPGDNSLAPYHRQHCLAEGIERILAASWRVFWDDYGAQVEALSQHKSKENE